MPEKLELLGTESDMRCARYDNNQHQQLIVEYLYHRLIVRFGEVLLLKTL